jgi:hypothetical protein
MSRQPTSSQHKKLARNVENCSSLALLTPSGHIRFPLAPNC